MSADVEHGTWSHEPPRNRGVVFMSRSASAVRTGVGFGSALAITISWSMNKSILWAILHGIFSWCYVVYYWIRYA